MTDLQRVEISGFKGIEHLEYEPSGVNLVTGRNNTGKTSLLEAIALAFDPTYVEEFGEDIDSLIHKDFEECEIVVEMEEGTREVGIRHPRSEQVNQLLMLAITSFLSNSYGVQLRMDDMGSQPLDDEYYEVQEQIETLSAEVGSQVVSQHSNDNTVKETREEFLIFSINGDEYPYLVTAEKVEALMKTASKELLNKAKEEFEHVENNVIFTEESLRDKAPRFFLSEGPVYNLGFLNTPPATDCSNFIKSKNLLSAPDFDPDEDAVKRDRLADYIKESELVDDLKTFNFDTLIFKEEDEERYPVPYDFMGDGFKTVIGLLWELMDDEVKDQIVLLEEPENHMHPGYVLNVVHFLIELTRDEDVQLFVTTHNKDFIDAFFNKNRAGEQEEFLEEEFTLLQLQSDSALVEDYEDARKDLEELHLDLRGI